MANYSLVIDSTFQPFSLERYLQPSQLYTAAYREVEDNLSELEVQAGQWDKLANETTDPKAHKIYTKYADELRQQANDLAQYGLNPQSRRKMLNMRKRFQEEITPIATAYQRRRQLADEQRQRNVDGSLRFSTDFGTVSLDDLIDNPEMTYTTVSGTDIANRAGQMFQRLAAAAMKEPDIQKRKDLRGYLQILQQSGYDPEVALQDYGAEMPAEIKRVYDTIDTSFANNPAYDKDWGHSWINQAAYNLLGQKAYNIQDDKMVMSAAQAASNALGWASHRETVRHNQAMEAARTPTPGITPISEITNKDGTLNLAKVQSLAPTNGLAITKDLTSLVAKPSLPEINYGVGLSSGRRNFSAKGTQMSGFSVGDCTDFTAKVDFADNTNHLVQEAKRLVAEHFGLIYDPTDTLENDNELIDALVKDVTIYRDQDYIGNNHFAICLPGTSLDDSATETTLTKKHDAWVTKYNNEVVNSYTKSAQIENAKPQ